jgi:uridine monophosphate synthetase
MTLQVSSPSRSDTITLYEQIAKQAKEWSPIIGLVVGATDPIALSKARQAAGEDTWILAPGVGAQGGDLEASLKAGLNQNGTKMLIPVSRGISKAKDMKEAAKQLKDSINQARKKLLVRLIQLHHYSSFSMYCAHVLLVTRMMTTSLRDKS